MRFRATLASPVQFGRLVTSLSPLSKQATIKLKPDSVHLVCLSDTTANGVQVWSQIAVSSIFKIDHDFRLESNSNNEIYLEVSTEALAKALRSAHGATEVTIKLAKKGGQGPDGSGKGARPVLTLSIKTISKGMNPTDISQDVGVRVRKAAEMDLLKEPLCPTPDINIMLPPLATLKTICERLKTISPLVTISANHQGELKLRAESEDANVTTEWRGLLHPRPGEEDPAPTAEPNPSQFFSVTVDSKNLLKFLAAYPISSSTIASLCEGHCAIFYLYLASKGESQGGVLTYFVPAVSTGVDE
ncbi:hypothetical protein MVLG_03291 [Microbotryum lychnidis-dioicae p1A1 Lamole]|uniref:Checkpoint protein n=2 Tax=Microbotryum TaxID=34416 RepID=U5H7S0_USTV1|nr:hypothetical protein MVLG_03291 [Microbotryum lychnidis-dioicae p1A1 Lamole]SGZ20634.1 BQ5605_C021g09290 [Microbotryum silenes-dioicae]|eukprot:KDE06384.1 hypothetical protein MVLG_03291 [Microbotryum lychnidis-dioicae p1A1 Lamole]